MNLAQQIKEMKKLDEVLSEERYDAIYNAVKRDRTRGISMAIYLNNRAQKERCRGWLINRGVSLTNEENA